jgi:hypothetical protein
VGVTGALFMPLLAAIVALMRDDAGRRRLLRISTVDDFASWLRNSLKPLVMEVLSR